MPALLLQAPAHMTASHLLLYILGCIVLIGFFAGTEIAFVSANKINIELKKKQGTFAGRILARFMEKPSEFIGTSLIGVNVLLVVYGILMTHLNERWMHLIPFLDTANPYIKLLIDTIVATFVILIFAEFLPKAIFRSKAEQVLSIFALPMLVMFYLLYPLARFFVAISEFILKYLFSVRVRDKQNVFNRVDLEQFVKQSLQGQDKESSEVNTELFENALYLVNVKVRRCMVPRNEIYALPNTSTIQEVRQKFIDTHLSRIVVYEGSIDTIVGYIHHLDLNRRPVHLQDIMHPIIAVPEAMTSVDLMNRFTRERKSIAWVVDEFGGTAGIVTMEDILEEIFGEIRDEYDVEEYIEQQIAANEYILSGRLELEHLNDKYQFGFPTDDSETLSGFIISNYGSIPKNKECIYIDHYEFTILLVGDTRIESVKLKVLPH